MPVTSKSQRLFLLEEARISHCGRFYLEETATTSVHWVLLPTARLDTQAYADQRAWLERHGLAEQTFDTRMDALYAITKIKPFHQLEAGLHGGHSSWMTNDGRFFIRRNIVERDWVVSAPNSRKDAAWLRDVGLAAPHNGGTAQRVSFPTRKAAWQALELAIATCPLPQ